MRYETPGNGTSSVEITNVSTHGLWLLIRDQEVFLPFDKFPWFKDAPIGKVVNVELPTAQHLYWPELDVDLEVDSALHPERYPLVSRVHEAREGYAPAKQAAGVDEEKIDDCVLALLQLTLHDRTLAWNYGDGITGTPYLIRKAAKRPPFLRQPRRKFVDREDERRTMKTKR